MPLMRLAHLITLVLVLRDLSENRSNSRCILYQLIHLTGYSYERLDGSVRGEERYVAIQNFNETEDTFIFLLSTRAGKFLDIRLSFYFSPSHHLISYIIYINDSNYEVLSKIFRLFPKILENSPKFVITLPIISRRFPKIAENVRRFHRKIRRCFNCRPTPLHRCMF